MLEWRKNNLEYVKEDKQGLYNHRYEGIINNLRRRYLETNSDYIKKQIEQI
jgi:excinuclease ABC subunit A